VTKMVNRDKNGNDNDHVDYDNHDGTDDDVTQHDYRGIENVTEYTIMRPLQIYLKEHLNT